jgi:6-pyruvoyltetrahydropterin/6-carboxytetrahydropterin synthase
MHEMVLVQKINVRHALMLYDGKREPEHDHEWGVEAHIESAELDAIGAVADMFVVDRALGEVLAELEGRFLNETPPFDRMNSSGERIAEFIYHRLSPNISPPARLRRVVILREEAPRARFTYIHDTPPR